MNIIAKKGSALEQTIKEMCGRISDMINGALDMVEKASGVRPTGIYRIFHWGIISRLSADFVINKEDEAKINPHVLRKKKGNKDVWVPAARFREGAALNTAFNEYAREHELRDELLHEFGIYTCKDGVSYYCQPAYDKSTDKYMLVCSDSIPKSFDKRLAREQFEIEY